MRLEIAGYSNRAGCEVNCDALLWRERDFGMVAALCSVERKRIAAVGAAKLASLRLLEMAEEVYCAADAKETLRAAMKEICADGFPDAVFGASLLVVRDGLAAWAGAGSTRLYIFSKGGVRRLGASPDITAADSELAPGDALLLGSDGFCRNVAALECEIDLYKSRDAAQWLEYLTLRHAVRSRLEGGSFSLLLCAAVE